MFKKIPPMLIPRLEDMPYYLCPPIQFVFSQTAPLQFGQYVFPLTKALFTPDRPILDNALYYFRTLTCTADITELDYESSVDVSAGAFQFHCFERSLSGAPRFREPILIAKFLENFDYRLLFLPRQEPNELLGSFQGTITQTASLVGKTAITFKMVISAQEITDDGFVDLITRNAFPGLAIMNGGS